MSDKNPTPAGSAGQQPQRGRRKVAIGIVTSDKMNKTRRVEIPRLVQHPRYGKYIRRRTICYVHDENNKSHVGDTVKIMETRPLSKLKRWRLVEIIARSGTKRLVENEALGTSGPETAQLPARANASSGSVAAADTT